MTNLRVLVADDELIARKRLLRLLAAIEFATVAGECANGTEVLARVAEGDVDVILLDIHMPGLSGLEASSLLPDDGPRVILCTAHADHALEAFELGALDYILKPVDAGRLKKALLRARDARFGKPAGDAASSGRTLARLAVPTKNGIVLLDPRAVSHALLDEQLVTIVADGATYLSDQPLNDLQERLPRDLFERVHRRALVNLEHVARLEPLESGGFLAHMRGGAAVEVSRQAARELRKRLKLR